MPSRATEDAADELSRCADVAARVRELADALAALPLRDPPVRAESTIAIRSVVETSMNVAAALMAGVGVARALL